MQFSQLGFSNCRLLSSNEQECTFDQSAKAALETKSGEVVSLVKNALEFRQSCQIRNQTLISQYQEQIAVLERERILLAQQIADMENDNAEVGAARTRPSSTVETVLSNLPHYEPSIRPPAPLEPVMTSLDQTDPIRPSGTSLIR